MSKYTTGEIARLCGVSVRTVQYYDTRGILVPSELSEGGRRLYSEDDLKRMRIICFLRDVGLSLNSISELFSDSDPASVISILLDQQEALLCSEINERQAQLSMVEKIKKELKSVEYFSVESIGDIAHVMHNRKKLYQTRAVMLTVGLISEVFEVCTLILWIFKGVWLPYVMGIPVSLGIAVWLTVFYFSRVKYICPKCHTVFKPKFREALFANHTMTTRKLTCVNCGHYGFSVETYGKEENEK